MCTVSDLLVPRLIELRLRASVIWCNHRNGVLHLIYSRRPRRWFIEVRESIRIPFSWLAKLQNIVLFLFVSMKARSSKRPRFFPWFCHEKSEKCDCTTFESLYDGQFTLSTQLIKSNYLVILPTDAAPQFLSKLTPLFIYYMVFGKNISCGTGRVVPSGRDISILPARVANYNTGFYSSHLLVALAI